MFAEAPLLDDTIMVLQDTVQQVDVGGSWKWTPDMVAMAASMMPQSPMEVQLNGNTTGPLDDGVWVPVGLQAKCTPGLDGAQPGQNECSLNKTTGEKLQGWNTVSVEIGSLPLVRAINSGAAAVYTMGTSAHPPGAGGSEALHGMIC